MSRVGEFSFVFLRDLDRLATEVRAYPTDEALWLMGGAIPNSGGTLALHLAGNLRHFVGGVLGASGYRRDREREFAARGLSREELLGEIEAARAAVESTLAGLSDADLDRPWSGGGPLGEDATNGAMLLHLSGHLMYHVGQINVHRRLLAEG